ncbi:hypothetical protein ILYODFUR_033770 [Ilyodon furcidens]|uniref:Uncharacterized protein n=1 Tax=Ilyodon furcidens TaxID=33524 RepID=A0ABV0UCL6_9TELE
MVQSPPLPTRRSRSPEAGRSHISSLTGLFKTGFFLEHELYFHAPPDGIFYTLPGQKNVTTKNKGPYGPPLALIIARICCCILLLMVESDHGAKPPPAHPKDSQRG